MLKALQVLLFFILCGTKLLAQWNSAINLTAGTVDADFVTESRGMYCADNYISPSSGTAIGAFLTNNAGTSWGSVFSSINWNSSYAIRSVRNQNTLYYIWNYQGSYHILKINSNSSSPQNFTGGNGFFQDFSAVDTSHVFFLAGWGYFLNKYSNGLVTNKIDSFIGVSPRLLLFTDTMTGYIAVSKTQYAKIHTILKSTTGGTGWSQVFSDTTININKMYFTKPNLGYAVGDSGKMIKTIDGGLNWSFLNTGTYKNLNSTYFINDSIGYAAGDSGVIIKTINGGTNWFSQSTGTNKIFSKIFFVNDSVGFALAGSTIYKINATLFVNTVEILNNNKIVVSPNPSSGIFTIDTKFMNGRLDVFDITGKSIYSCKTENYINQIDLSNVNSGLYFLRVTKDGALIKQEKIVISK